MFSNPTHHLRPCLTIALVPVVPAVGVLLMLVDPFSAADDIRFLLAVTTGTAVVLCTLIWLHLIRWTLGRVLGTTSATAVVVVHLAVWQPVWDVGCVNDLMLAGQGITVLGLWIWLVPLVWWGAVKYSERGSGRLDALVERTNRMRGVPAGYMRAVALVPVVCGVYVVTFLIIDDVTGWGNWFVWVCANVLGSAVLAVGWVWAWRIGVNWAAANRRETAVLCLGLVTVSGLSGLIEAGTDWIDSLRINLPLLFAGAFMGLTAWRWPAKGTAGAEGEVAPLCPECGYNMTGLQQARCPECGQSYTLDELYAANGAMISAVEQT